MLIIFDLDDTLIDTSGAIVPFKLKLCLERLKELGLRYDDFEAAYERLLALNAAALRSRDALEAFINLSHGDPSWLELVLPTMVSPLPEDFIVPTTPFAKEILEELRISHDLTLVTAGYPPFQKEKLKKAGIEPSLFSNILIPEDCIKRPAYEALYKQFFKGQALVCGDRIWVDLLPAHELGFTTVHMRWGRGLLNQTEPWIDYSISGLRELRDIVR